MFEDRIPYVGQMVHYKSHGTPIREDGTQAFTGECRAAIVAAQGEGNLLSLCVLNPDGLFFNKEVDRDETADQGGTWHWFKQ